MQAHTVYVISKGEPIKYILSRPVLHKQLTKWQYDLVHISHKAIKGQALADFLADHPVPDDWELNDDLLEGDVFFVHVLPL